MNDRPSRLTSFVYFFFFFLAIGFIVWFTHVTRFLFRKSHGLSARRSTAKIDGPDLLFPCAHLRHSRGSSIFYRQYHLSGYDRILLSRANYPTFAVSTRRIRSPSCENRRQIRVSLRVKHADFIIALRANGRATFRNVSYTSKNDEQTIKLLI